ncbi:hypothetical protein [Lentzea sp. E54]|uniref:hypothetical protein n=1 Tax=Lentzea xerophila TaxID=3435883 RepID=UPI003DA26AC0
MSDTAENMWALWRECLDVVIASARTRVAAEGLELLVEVDPTEEPSPAAVWSWHLTCVAGDVEVDVIASRDLAAFAIEDDSGRFEIEADSVTFAEVLARRLLR